MNVSPKTPALCLALALLVAVSIAIPAAARAAYGNQEEPQHRIERAKIFREAYPLISDTDLYCSIYLHSAELPAIRITAADKGDEKILLSDADVFFINKGEQDGLEIGQIFLIIEIGQPIGSYGYLAHRCGRCQVVSLEDNRAVAKVEKTCGRIMIGDYLLPFEEKESMLGKDLGYEKFSEGESGAVGRIIYLQGDHNQIGSGGWAIIDIGEEAGVMVGQQMTIFRQSRPDLPREGIGNLIVIDTQPRTATIKVLSCSDPVRLGLQVQAK
jgi:hypothetical protein